MYKNLCLKQKKEARADFLMYRLLKILNFIQTKFLLNVLQRSLKIKLIQSTEIYLAAEILLVQYSPHRYKNGPQ